MGTGREDLGAAVWESGQSGLARERGRAREQEEVEKQQQRALAGQRGAKDGVCVYVYVCERTCESVM